MLSLLALSASSAVALAGNPLARCARRASESRGFGAVWWWRWRVAWCLRTRPPCWARMWEGYRERAWRRFRFILLLPRCSQPALLTLAHESAPLLPPKRHAASRLGAGRHRCGGRLCRVGSRSSESQCLPSHPCVRYLFWSCPRCVFHLTMTTIATVTIAHRALLFSLSWRPHDTAN